MDFAQGWHEDDSPILGKVCSVCGSTDFSRAALGSIVCNGCGTQIENRQETQEAFDESQFVAGREARHRATAHQSQLLASLQQSAQISSLEENIEDLGASAILSQRRQLQSQQDQYDALNNSHAVNELFSQLDTSKNGSQSQYMSMMSGVQSEKMTLSQPFSSQTSDHPMQGSQSATFDMQQNLSQQSDNLHMNAFSSHHDKKNAKIAEQRANAFFHLPQGAITRTLLSSYQYILRCQAIVISRTVMPEQFHPPNENSLNGKRFTDMKQFQQIYTSTLREMWSRYILSWHARNVPIVIVAQGSIHTATSKTYRRVITAWRKKQMDHFSDKKMHQQHHTRTPRATRNTRKATQNDPSNTRPLSRSNEKWADLDALHDIALCKSLTLGFHCLVCRWLRVPIGLADIVALVKSGSVPFHNVFSVLPAKIKSSTAFLPCVKFWEGSNTSNTHSSVSIAHLERQMYQLARFIGIPVPACNGLGIICNGAVTSAVPWSPLLQQLYTTIYSNRSIITSQVLFEKPSVHLEAFDRFSEQDTIQLSNQLESTSFSNPDSTAGHAGFVALYKIMSGISDNNNKPFNQTIKHFNNQFSRFLQQVSLTYLGKRIWDDYLVSSQANDTIKHLQWPRIKLNQRSSTVSMTNDESQKTADTQPPKLMRYHPNKLYTRNQTDANGIRPDLYKDLIEQIGILRELLYSDQSSKSAVEQRQSFSSNEPGVQSNSNQETNNLHVDLNRTYIPLFPLKTSLSIIKAKQRWPRKIEDFSRSIIQSVSKFYNVPSQSVYIYAVLYERIMLQMVPSAVLQ